jgi:hypothetical protein
VIPAGKVRTVLFLKDLNPSSSICLIRICPTTPPILRRLSSWLSNAQGKGPKNYRATISCGAGEIYCFLAPSEK